MSHYDPSLLAPITGLKLLRLGRNKDGGYVIPQVCLSASKYLLSAGIYTDWSFEDQFISLSQSLGYLLIDPTTSIRSLFAETARMVIQPNCSPHYKLLKLSHLIYNLFRVPIMRRRYGSSFVEYFLSPSRLPDISNKMSTEITIPASLEKLGLDTCSSLHHASTFLKIDIEGSEYELMSDIVSYSQFFSGIALEVHDLDNRYKEFSDLMKSLHAAGFLVAHCHPNNSGGVIEGTRLPRLLEITFVNKILLSSSDRYSKSPPFLYRVGLDFPCDPRLPELEVSRNTVDSKSR